MLLYTSFPASPRLAELAATLARTGRTVELLPLEDLPSARPQRLGPLRVEHTDVLQNLAFVNWALALLENGTWQPDAELAAALDKDKASLVARLEVIAPLLHALEGVVVV